MDRGREQSALRGWGCGGGGDREGGGEEGGGREEGGREGGTENDQRDCLGQCSGSLNLNASLFPISTLQCVDICTDARMYALI